MRAAGAASLRAGVAGGLIEFRQEFSGTALIGQLFWPVATLASLSFLRYRLIGGSGFALGALMLPGLLGMFVALGMMLMAQYLPADREDGTLLRAKATPDGIRGYLVGKLVTSSLSVLVYLFIVGVPGFFLVRGVSFRDISWLTVAWVLALGLIGTQLIGAVLGALISGPRAVGYVSFPVIGLVAISGIFYPVTALPGWVQGIAQVFPVYWLGLGMRSAFLPGGAASVEIAGSWRPAETAAVLGAWALAGLVVAPLALSRMARRESGSRIAARRERALDRAH